MEIKTREISLISMRPTPLCHSIRKEHLLSESGKKPPLVTRITDRAHIHEVEVREILETDTYYLIRYIKTHFDQESIKVTILKGNKEQSLTLSEYPQLVIDFLSKTYRNWQHFA